jgi:hypothetical protein
MGLFTGNAALLFLGGFLILMLLHLHRKLNHKRGFFREICLLAILGMFSLENVGPTRNSLHVGPILFTSERPSPLARIFAGNRKVFAIENRGKETLLTSVAAFSETILSEFMIIEGEEYLKESREGPGQRNLALAIPAGGKVGIQTSDDVVLEPLHVHALQFGVHSYYSRGGDLPPVRLK